MRIFPIFFLGAIFIVFFTKEGRSQFQYINPFPGSTYHNPETNIILKNGSRIDEKSLTPSLVSINGSTSGQHSVTIRLANDKNTILIFPDQKFDDGETVNVFIGDGFRKETGALITGTSFSFQIHPHFSDQDLEAIKNAREACKKNEYEATALPPDGNIRETCHLPSYDLFMSGNEWNADVFYYSFTQNNPICYARTIMTNDGDSVYADFNNNQGVGFEINKNGYLTWYDDTDSSFLMADSTYSIVKEFFMKNGYVADNHEFLVYPDGHSFMFCYDVHLNVDLTAYGGLPSANVIGVVIQELDSLQDVVFEWSSWDHFEIDDIVSWQPLFNDSTVDYVHANSMDIDYDGNLLLSSRHLSEITKIDLTTGNIIWRFGGENNQFTFINDPAEFSGQHHFRRLPNGHYTMFNNGNQVLPYSEAKEYILDQANLTATLYWHYIHPQITGSNVLSNAMGSVQRLPNGNTFIDYGLILNTAKPFPRFTEVDSLGNIVWEFRFTDTVNYVSYRAFKNRWDRCTFPDDTSFSATGITSDSAFLSWGDPTYASSYILEYKLSTETLWTSIALTSNSIWLDSLIGNSVYDWRIKSVCDVFNDTSFVSTEQHFNTISTTSLSAVNTVGTFRFYPNPATEAVTLSLDLDNDELLAISVTDMVGKQLISQTRNGTTGKNKLILNTRRLAPGVYTIEVKSNGFLIQKQLVIQ